MTGRVILIAFFVVCAASVSSAQGLVFETIYDPNAPGATAPPERALNGPLHDYDGWEPLSLSRPAHRIFEAFPFGHAKDY